MLKVSLLPESYRKKIIGAKKKEQLKQVSLVVLIMLLALLVVIVVVRKKYSEKYDSIQKLNAEAVARFPELEEYQSLYNEIEKQKQLIDTVSVKEPYAQDFIVELGNIEYSGVWLTSISAEDWQYSKQCTIEGNCLTYEECQNYIEKIKNIEGVLSAEVSTFTYTDDVSDTGTRICSFTIVILCDGAGTPYVAPTEPVVSTTAEDAAE